jgi:hypothetical protein
LILLKDNLDGILALSNRGNPNRQPIISHSQRACQEYNVSQSLRWCIDTDRGDLALCLLYLHVRKPSVMSIILLDLLQQLDIIMSSTLKEQLVSLS